MSRCIVSFGFRVRVRVSLLYLRTIAHSDYRYTIVSISAACCVIFAASGVYCCIAGRTDETTEPDSDIDKVGRDEGSIFGIPWVAKD